jgi:lipopolysaccharide export system protein LptC
MTVTPLPARRPARVSRERHLADGAPLRRPPSPSGIARRRLLIRLTKVVLPLAALALLALIALWPEIDRATDHGRLSFSQFAAEVDGAKLTDARYRGVDEQGRPYTVTAKTAKQVTPERVNLTMPVGDLSMKDGTWLQVQSKDGVYLQHIGSLDLSHDVILYRDGGTTMTTESASIDLKSGAGAGSQPVHAEGPFGTLDAQGFVLTDSGAAIQFQGPARLVLNGANSR